MQLIKKLIKKVCTAFKKSSQLIRKESGYYKPAYRIVSIEKDETDQYYITIQVIGKPLSYKAKPEKLLSDDKLVNLFSPIDIRNLTYLGYLGINAPKYKILAKQLSDQKGETLFAIKKKGEKDHHVVTATEISTNEDILKGLSQTDAHMIGFTTAAEQTSIERQQKEKIMKEQISDDKKIRKNKSRGKPV